jgi:hypothetical protein
LTAVDISLAEHTSEGKEVKPEAALKRAARATKKRFAAPSANGFWLTHSSRQGNRI